MKSIIVVAALAAAMAGCGVETMGTAATGAMLKKQELEQGKSNMQQAQQKIDRAVQQMNQSAQRAADDGIK
jgi:hypothetical protein